MIESKQSPQPTKKRVKPFRTLNDLVTEAVKQFRFRRNWRELGGREGTGAGRSHARRVAEARDVFHQRIMASGRYLLFCRACHEQNLDAFEVEVLLALSLSQMGVLDSEITTPQELGDELAYTAADRYELLIKLGETGRLARQELLSVVNDGLRGIPLKDTEFRVAGGFLRLLLHEERIEDRPYPMKFERGCGPHLRDYLRKAMRRAELVGQLLEGDLAESELEQRTELFLNTHRRLKATLKQNPDWGLTRLLALAEDNEEDEIVLLILAGKAMGLLRLDHPVFSSGLIARAARLNDERLADELECIEPEGRLRTADLVKSTGTLEEDNPFDDAEGEVLELTPKALEILGVKRRRAKHSRVATGSVVTPRLSMDGIVVPDDVREQLQMAVAQARYSPVLMDAWGMRRRFPYGTGATILFSGPPGVGKTACAEALAHELGKKLLTIDYAQLQSCYVGSTEKNIAETFRAANHAEAVLFWDEADAMLTSRNSAVRKYEVSQVNVLLQEIEKFDGVCIFATNRKPSLDPALERRITMKIELDRPDRHARRQLWQTLLPDELPVGPDVGLDDLAEHDLSGGEIKNVILNAARRALLRSPEGPVTMEDFDQALKMEREGRFDGKPRIAIGFRPETKRHNA